MSVNAELLHDVSVGKIAATINNKFDASTLHDKPKLAAESQLVDDGTGQRRVWRIEKFQLVPVPEKLYGVFFSGDCYVVKYTYLVGGTEKYLLYYWLVSYLMFICLNMTVYADVSIIITRSTYALQLQFVNFCFSKIYLNEYRKLHRYFSPCNISMPYVASR
jgi:hypothetical protein